MSSTCVGLPYAMRTTAVLTRPSPSLLSRLFARATRAFLARTLAAEGGPRRPRARRLCSRRHLDRRPLVHELDQAPQHRRIRLRQDSVPEVEDVPRPPPDRLQNSP